MTDTIETISQLINSDKFVRDFVKNSTAEIKEAIIQQIKEKKIDSFRVCITCVCSDIDNEWSKYKRYCLKCFKDRAKNYYKKSKENGKYKYEKHGIVGRPKKLKEEE